MRPEESFIGQPIRSLQTMLRTIAEDKAGYQSVIPDGIYGPETMSAVLPAILYGSILAALFSLILMAAKKLGRKDTIPLVPFLYLGILIVLFGA